MGGYNKQEADYKLFMELISVELEKAIGIVKNAVSYKSYITSYTTVITTFAFDPIFDIR